tara:strand:+ start:8152 stop:8622 length:471 start_codon:yes stop_codon:yes gene_type:complete
MRKKHIQYQKDERFGKKYEDLLLEYFLSNPEIHGEDIKKTKNKWNVVDYINDNWVCELKSRRYSIHDFNSLMIGKNKIEEAEKAYKQKNHKSYRFYFTMKEGIYYWDYEPNPESDDEELFYYFAMGGRCDRGRDERKETAYIFSDNLKLLTDKIHS